MLPKRLNTAAKALRELGPQPLGAYALYRLGLKSGHLRRVTPAAPWLPEAAPAAVFEPALPLPAADFLRQALPAESVQLLYQEAGEILNGEARLFGGPPVALRLETAAPLFHWTAYELGQAAFPLDDLPAADVKWLWEPARFGWAVKLGQAYYLSRDERYAQAFWENSETFLAANPPNLGPQWVSAQEVALRLIALALAGQLCLEAQATTPERRARLAQALAVHAARIPPSLAYARSQNNNHLLSEAAGLLTAACYLPAHPQARRWRALGWRWFVSGLKSQFTPGGVYMQHSTNYHRLALQLALWVAALLPSPAAGGPSFPEQAQSRLAAATNWLLARLDPISGRTPNLGPNDGANILPLSGMPFHDYRPVVQAAGTAFLETPPLPAGAWDDLGLWLGQKTLANRAKSSEAIRPVQTPETLRHPDLQSWVVLRAARFTSRPGHADQLHLDLWWQGHNLARDAGTYLYNAPPPWDNALQGSAFHNTVTVNGRDQMTRAGRFLWLDWAQAQLLSAAPDSVVAEHDGYRSLGVQHRRSVHAAPDGWTVSDELYPLDDSALATRKLRFTLHWLLPDWPYQWNTQKGVSLSLKAPDGAFIKLIIRAQKAGSPDGLHLQPRLARAGERLAGPDEVNPAAGWWAPTYGYKEPALALQVTVELPAPVTFLSEWILPPPAGHA